MIEQFFYLCIRVLEVIGETTRTGYFLADIFIFVILHPAATLFLFCFWRNERQLRMQSK